MRMRSSDSSDNGEDETVSSDVSSLTALEHYVFLHGLGDSILILGGGNLTFAWSLAHLHPEKKILATVSSLILKRANATHGLKISEVTEV